jgi:hypothetical protein
MIPDRRLDRLQSLQQRDTDIMGECKTSALVTDPGRATESRAHVRGLGLRGRIWTRLGFRAANSAEPPVKSVERRSLTAYQRSITPSLAAGLAAKDGASRHPNSQKWREPARRQLAAIFGGSARRRSWRFQRRGEHARKARGKDGRGRGV